MKLDETDARILKLLQEDARLSFREIGKKVGVSTPTVSARVRALEEQGVIRGYSARIDTEAINEVTSVVVVECPPKRLDAIAKEVGENDNVREVLVLSGSKIMCRLVTETEGRLDAFLAWLEGIGDITRYAIDRVVRTTKSEPDAVISEGVSISVPCYLCRKPVGDEPVVLRMDGKAHYLCCESCSKLYREKYEKLKQGTSAGHH